MTNVTTQPRLTSLAPQLLAGITIMRPLTSTEWATKDFYIEDPDGYVMAFGGRPA